MESLNPIWLSVIGGLIVVFATYLTQTRQSGNTTAIRQELKDQTELLRGLAAQTGDDKALQDAIDSRTKVLSESRAPAASEIDQILKDVPRLAEDYKKLQQSKSSAEETKLAEFRLKWEPPIQMVVAEFDRRLDAVIAKGVKAELKKEPFKIAGIRQDGGSSQLTRVATLNGVELRLYVSSAQIHPDRIESAHVDVTVRLPEKQENDANPLSATLSLADATIAGKTFPASLNSATDKAFSEAMLAGINKGIETWLVIANGKN